MRQNSLFGTYWDNDPWTYPLLPPFESVNQWSWWLEFMKIPHGCRLSASPETLRRYDDFLCHSLPGREVEPSGESTGFSFRGHPIYRIGI